jgi:type II secretory pathway component PulF
MMKRLLMVLTVAALMVAMTALSAVPSFAQVFAGDEQVTETGDAVIVDVGPTVTETGDAVIVDAGAT